MKVSAPSAHYSRGFVLIFLICAACNCQATQSGSDGKFKLKHSALSHFFKYKKEVRGLTITEGIYLGRTKVNGKKRVGLIIEHNNVFWNVNNRGISINKRF